MPHEELGGEGEDQGNGGGDPDAREDVRQGARQRHPVEALELPDPKERAVSVAIGSTSRTPYIVCTSSGQKAPNVARKDLALQVRAQRQEEQRDQRGRRDRTQELDRDAKGRAGEVARAERDPDRHREHDREPEADRPAAHRLAERRPEVAGLHQVPERVEGVAHRRQVALRDHAGARDQLPQREGGEHGDDGDGGVEKPRKRAFSEARGPPPLPIVRILEHCLDSDKSQLRLAL